MIHESGDLLEATASHPSAQGGPKHAVVGVVDDDWARVSEPREAQETTLQQQAAPSGKQAPDAGKQAAPDAGSPPGEQQAYQIDPVVVTATMSPTPREQLPVAVSVITGAEITKYNYDRLEDVFRDVPGVQVQTSGSPGKATSLSIRGGGPQRALVLVDGMRTNSPTLGSTDIAEFTIDAIDRIEIVRGPQSTLYGADAITGVVNIITKKGQGDPSASVWVEGGNYDTFREQVNVQGAYRGFNWNVTGSQFNTAGNLPHDDSSQTAVSGRVGYDFPWRGELTLTGRYSNLNLELPISSTSPTVLDSNATNHLETGLYKLAYTQKISDWWTVTGSVGQWFNSSTFRGHSRLREPTSRTPRSTRRASRPTCSAPSRCPSGTR